jgi:hypothetical protein
MKTDKLTIFYRLSDKWNPKNRVDYVNNKNCLENFMKEFPLDKIVVIADNITDETFNWLNSIRFKQLHRTSLGNSGSFWYTFQQALKLEKNEYVYFVENDYIHKLNSMKVLLEGLQISDYVTLYDHPDKYVKNGAEKSRVFLTESTHWKITNSTTMTFASKVSTLKKDKFFFKFFSLDTTNSKLPIMRKYMGSPNPHDYRLFVALSTFKRRRLISPIPSYSTHGEKKYLAPLIDWKSFINAQ